MNRIILKVKFTSEKSIKLTLVYIDRRFLSTGINDFKYFFDHDENFMLYSYDKFTFTYNALKFPSNSGFKYNETIDIEMESKEKMKMWLLQLYRTLHNWNSNFTDFKKLPDYDDRPSKVNIQKEHWIL